MALNFNHLNLRKILIGNRSKWLSKEDIKDSLLPDLKNIIEEVNIKADSADVEENLIKIGELTKDDLNLGDSKVFAGAKPAGKYFDKIFLHTEQVFTGISATPLPTISVNMELSPLVNSLDQKVVSFQALAGLSLQAYAEADISISASFGDEPANPQDWTAGKISVYGILKDFPI